MKALRLDVDKEGRGNSNIEREKCKMFKFGQEEI